MNKFIALLAISMMLTLSACGMKRALTLPEKVENKKQADEKDLVSF